MLATVTRSVGLHRLAYGQGIKVGVIGGLSFKGRAKALS